MARNPLESLIRVRRIALDETRRTLAQCLEAEETAARTRAEAESEIVRERQAAENIGAGDAAVEAYAAWLPGARERLLRAVAAQERMAADIARARAALTVARGSYEAAEDANARRLADERTARQGREQAAIDEFASQVRKE